MIKIILTLFLLVLSCHSPAKISAADRAEEGEARIPDRDATPKYPPRGLVDKILCMPRIINEEFSEDLALTHALMRSLKEESPTILRELFLKSQIEDYRLSAEATHLLDQFGFFDADRQIKRTWRSLIVCSLLKEPARLLDYVRMAAVEDLASKFPQIISLLKNHAAIPLATCRTLAMNYQLIAHETEATLEEIDSILIILRRLNPQNIPHTFLRPNTLADLMHSSEIIFP